MPKVGQFPSGMNNFTPNPNMGRNLGPNPNNSDSSQFSNQNTGFTERNKIVNSVNRGKKNSKVISAVKITRKQLEEWLLRYGLKLLTSSVELQLTQNFIQSSYVQYPNGNLIHLGVFLQQTDPQIQKLALAISNHIKPVTAQLDVTRAAKENNLLDDFDPNLFLPGI